MVNRICFVGLVALSTIWVGCGKGDPLNRQAVSGTVTLDGQPLDQGVIEFHPAIGSAGIHSGGAISHGEFSVPRDKGLPPGTYTVQISSGDVNATIEEEEGAPPGGSPPPLVERIPARYGVASELSIEVVAGEPNRFPFELTSN